MRTEYIVIDTKTNKVKAVFEDEEDAIVLVDIFNIGNNRYEYQKTMSYWSAKQYLSDIDNYEESMNVLAKHIEDMTRKGKAHSVMIKRLNCRVDLSYQDMEKIVKSGPNKFESFEVMKSVGFDRAKLTKEDYFDISKVYNDTKKKVDYIKKLMKELKKKHEEDVELIADIEEVLQEVVQNK